MSKSFRITNGDLEVGVGRSYQQVTGQAKLFQDLKLWVLEKIGTDPATPTYGSRLDGGVIGGEEIPSYIGQTITQERMADIAAEVSDLLALYQEEQLAKMQREAILYQGEHTLAPEEILHRVDDISTAQVGTTILVRVACTTLAGNSFRLTIPASI
jgi:hypothetical protein